VFQVHLAIFHISVSSQHRVRRPGLRPPWYRTVALPSKAVLVLVLVASNLLTVLWILFLFRRLLRRFSSPSCLASSTLEHVCTSIMYRKKKKTRIFPIFPASYLEPSTGYRLSFSRHCHRCRRRPAAGAEYGFFVVVFVSIGRGKHLLWTLLLPFPDTRSFVAGFSSIFQQ
jgi:hypothetical protein